MRDQILRDNARVGELVRQILAPLDSIEVGVSGPARCRETVTYSLSRRGNHVVRTADGEEMRVFRHDSHPITTAAAVAFHRERLAVERAVVEWGERMAKQFEDTLSVTPLTMQPQGDSSVDAPAAEHIGRRRQRSQATG